MPSTIEPSRACNAKTVKYEVSSTVIGSSNDAHADSSALAESDIRDLARTAATDNGSICATAMPRTR